MILRSKQKALIISYRLQLEFLVKLKGKKNLKPLLGLSIIIIIIIVKAVFQKNVGIFLNLRLFMILSEK